MAAKLEGAMAGVAQFGVHFGLSGVCSAGAHRPVSWPEVEVEVGAGAGVEVGVSTKVLLAFQSRVGLLERRI